MKISGWGRDTQIDATVHAPRTVTSLRSIIEDRSSFSGIPRGMGRSYGDSAMAQTAISTLQLNHLISFDRETGVLECQAGCTLDSLIDLMVPMGWFLGVTPGTRQITIGGAIASDVHGKNHHHSGCFSEFVDSFRLLLATGEIISCSREENMDLFHATCGGMGLTGIIVDAKVRLVELRSRRIRQRTIRTGDLAETLRILREHHDATYSAAWIDCLSGGPGMGRSLVMLGEHATDGHLERPRQLKLSVPAVAPGFLLNREVGRVFNEIVYRRPRRLDTAEVVDMEGFFYPLDRIGNWNRLYGNAGFAQYQCVVPLESSADSVGMMLSAISRSECAALLGVIKCMGPQNANHLSFPSEGVTLAVDLKTSKTALDLMHQLDAIVVQYGGRIYLTKDSRLSRDYFRLMYPRWEEFLHLRQRIGADRLFNSLQSARLGI